MPRPQTPITFESFNGFVMPQIRKMFQEEFQKIDKKFEARFETIETKLEDYREEIIGFKVEMAGEAKSTREELAITLNQYRRINVRLTRVEKHLGLASA